MNGMVQVILMWVVALAFVPLLIWWGLWLVFALLAVVRSRGAGSVRGGEHDFQGSEAPLLIDILIPAHNEEILLPRLLETLRLQTSRDRIHTILVVADHCTDRTAAVARQASLERLQVLERGSGPRGKPAALRDGLAWLKAAAGGISPTGRAVMILDADCTASPNLVEQTALALDAGATVTQAAYVLDESRHSPSAPPGARSARGAGERLHSAAFIAFALKNLVRPKGMAVLGLPTQLFGTGMALRADVLEGIGFSDHLTEDLAMSYELLLSGNLPRFLAAALVRSPLPEQRSAMTTQKLRWETGQLQTWTKVPAILWGLLSRRPGGWLRSTVAVVDWSAPPVAMAVLLWLGFTFASALLVALGGIPGALLGLPAASIGILAAYVVAGGVQISGVAAVGRLFFAVPRFLFWKIALYAQMLAGRGPRAWQRTPRSGAEQEVAPGTTPLSQQQARRFASE